MSRAKNYDQMITWFGRMIVDVETGFRVGHSDDADLTISPVYEVKIGSCFLGHISRVNGKCCASSARSPETVHEDTFENCLKWLQGQQGLASSGSSIGYD